MLHPQLLFDGYRFDPKDRHHAVPVHAIKVQLKDSLPYLIPILQMRVDITFQTVFPTERCSQGISCIEDLIKEKLTHYLFGQNG